MKEVTLPRSILMVSPAPVDGYPPVQHQARLLADAGYRVTLLTSTLSPWEPSVAFHHTGVEVSAVQAREPSLAWKVQRVPIFVGLLTRARASIGAQILAEFAFNPDGIFISDIAPLRPRVRVAHLHETVVPERSALEKRLGKAFRKYERIIIPDSDRAGLLRQQFGVANERVIVVPNYPLLEPAPATHAERKPHFEVIYGGSLGLDQKLDTIIRSVVRWPKRSRLTLLGDDTRPVARQLRRVRDELNLQDRVHFEGWVQFSELIRRYRRADLGISLLVNNVDQWRFASGASNKRYQYMQAGLPQIADSNPGVPELIEGNRIGLCVANGSEEEIASAVRFYSSDTRSAARAGHRAERLYRTRYNYNAAFSEVLCWLDGKHCGSDRTS